MKKKTKKQHAPTTYAGSTTSPSSETARGKYAARYRARTNLALLSSDVAKYFLDEQSVNTALRTR